MCIQHYCVYLWMVLKIALTYKNEQFLSKFSGATFSKSFRAIFSKFYTNIYKYNFHLSTNEW